MSTITKKTQKTKVIQTRLDASLVDKAAEILDYIGISTTDAVRILIKSIVNTGTFPLELKNQKKLENTNLELTETKIAEIEKKIDDYYAGKSKTTKIKNSKELTTFLDKLAS